MTKTTSSGSHATRAGHGISGNKSAQDAPTRLRVIELATPLLASLGAGAESWRIIKSKGGRGWYVDTATGWVAQPRAEGLTSEVPVWRRDLAKAHPWREALETLADANGNVGSGVGWHARKMEVSARLGYDGFSSFT